jgi:putative oxidoreductase
MNEESGDRLDSDQGIYPVWGNTVLLILRLFVAYIVIPAGWKKLSGGHEGIEGFSKYVASLGFPFPLISAYAAVLTEFFAPMFYVIGFGTRLASAPLIVTFIVATFVAHGSDVMSLNWGEFLIPLGVLISCMIVAWFGPGSFSVGGSADHED